MAVVNSAIAISKLNHSDGAERHMFEVQPFSGASKVMYQDGLGVACQQRLDPIIPLPFILKYQGFAN